MLLNCRPGENNVGIFQVRQDDYSGGVDSSFFKEDDLGKEEKTPSERYNFLASAGGKENLGQVIS